MWLAVSLATAQAQSFPGYALRARATAGAATMVSDSQRGWLGYDRIGGVGTLELGYGLLPLLELRVGAAVGGFPTGEHTGGLLQPQLGAALVWPDAGARPWLQLDAGASFTGKLVRPALRASVGVDFQLTPNLSLGPVLGYTQIFQHDRPLASTDARFVWFGLAVGLAKARHVVAAPPPRVIVREHERVVTQTRHVTDDPPLPPLPEPVTEPSPELRALLDSALPSQRQEWLAPVLFALDSAQLDPQGVAMLHEVARELNRRREIAAVEIHGYADASGDAEHNIRLSEQRAQAVRAWLIAHGVASDRLRIAAHGEQDPVEPGDSAPEHTQNRRVVFRVVEAGATP